MPAAMSSTVSLLDMREMTSILQKQHSAADGELLGRMTGYFAHIFHTDIKNS